MNFEETPLSRRDLLTAGLRLGLSAALGGPLLSLLAQAAPNEPLGTVFWQRLTPAPSSVQAVTVPQLASVSSPPAHSTGLPGSLMKIVAFCLIHDEQLPARAEHFDCRGVYMDGDTRWHCQHAHGRVNLTRAFAVSCNGFFVHASQRISPALFIEHARRLIPGFPAVAGANGGDSSLLVTGLDDRLTLSARDILGWMARLATRQADYRPGTWDALYEAMALAAHAGTGKQADPGGQSRLALKTGTVPRGTERFKQYQSWAAGFFPADRPHTAFCVRAPQGTSQDAAVPALRQWLASQRWQVRP